MPAPVTLDLSYLSNPNAARLERLGAQLHRRMAGGDVSADSPYTEQECMLALEEYRGKKQDEIQRYNADRLVKHGLDSQAYYRQQYFDDLEAIYKYGGTSERWTKHFDLPVRDDAARGLKYVELPVDFTDQARYQPLPSEELINRVERIKWAANQNGAFRYIVVPSGVARNFSGLYAGGMQGNVMVERDETRAYLIPDRGCPRITDEQLRVYVVIRPKRDGLGDPGLMLDVADADMILGAEQLLLRRGPEDKVSNNVPAEQPAA